MPVVIRKGSWEDHVTRASGLQYSYDDLDLVCCHGVGSGRPWMGAGASKPGQRIRCASMPEGYQQLPTPELAQTPEVTTSVVKDETESEEFKIVKSNVKVPLDLQEESAHSPHDLLDVNISQGGSESEHLQTTDIGNHCESNSEWSVANISCDTDNRSHSKKTMNDDVEVGKESNQNHEICIDGDVLKRPNITHEQQQCISISSNNGPLLSQSAGDEPGKNPDYQETKESHIEGYSRPPEIFDTTLNQSFAAGFKCQTDLPDAEEEKISTSGPADASTDSIMENGDVMSQAGTEVEPVMTTLEMCDVGVTERWGADSSYRLDGFNSQEILNENAGLTLHARQVQGGERDQPACPGVLDQDWHNVTQTVMPHAEESAQLELSEKKNNATLGTLTSSDSSFTGQCCSLTAEKLDTGFSEGNHTQANITRCVDHYLETTASVSQPRESRHESLVPRDLPCCEDQTVAQQLENSSSKLDTIPEVSHVEQDDTLVLNPQKNSNFTQNPDVQQSHVDDSCATTEHDTKNLPPCSAEVCIERSPGGLHSNQEVFGCCFSESPGSEAADGQWERHRPAATVSRMEDEAAHTATHSDTQLASSVLNGTSEPLDENEAGFVKVRLRKVRPCSLY